MACIFSTDQQSVIDSRSQNVLVSAAAGSGKTSVLTERIIQRIIDKENPIFIDRVLVVTFTKAAAAEMKGRIAQALEKKLKERPFDTHLQMQSSLIHNAMITTIDSFCLNVVKNNFHKIDLDPSFRPASNGERDLLMKDVMKALIKRYYAEADEDFLFLVDCYSKKTGDDTIEANILRLYNMSMSYPWPEKWLEERREDYNYSTVEELENSDLAGDYIDAVTQNLRAMIPAMENIIDRLDTPGAPDVYEDVFLDDIEQIKAYADMLSGCRLSEIINLPAVSWKRLPQAKEYDKEIKEQFQKDRNKVKDAVADEIAKLASVPVELQLEFMNSAGRVVNKLIDMTLDFIAEFSRAKRDRGIIDFSDMEHMAIDILIDTYNDDGTYEITDVAANYRNFFSEVMVDEYQDSNLVQEIIIRSVSREESDNPNRFMVGDVKQSIYRFRLARSKIFLDKMKAYSKDAAAHDRLITLKKNFRSRKSVIDSVNSVFENAMTLETSGMEYDDDARLYFGAEYSEDTVDNKSEIIMLSTDLKGDDLKLKQAEVVAERIRKLLANMKVTDRETKALRPVSYRDIAILCRSASKWADFLKEALEQRSIPFHMEGTGTFFETREIRDIMDFLRIIDNPLNDVALCGALTSFFGGFNDDDLARIKVAGSETDYYLWEKLMTYASGAPEDKKVSDFCALVERYRGLVKILPIQKLILTLLDETGFRNIVAALPDGRQRLANIELLVVKSAEYAKTSFSGLFHFLRYVELIKRMDSDEGEANVFDENADVVKIMTIHKSKGLEFPVCFIMGIDDEFSDNDITGEFITEVDAGIGANYIDPVRRIKAGTLRRNYIKEVIWRENVAEELRVLYVAMTRAREKLIMVGKREADKEYKVPVKKKSYYDFIYGARSKAAYFDEIEITDVDEVEKEVAEAVDRATLLAELTTGANADAELLNRLKERFSFEYPYKNLETLYTKTTVSELKLIAMAETDEEAAHEFHGNETAIYVPKFAGGEEEVKGSRRGTAYHNLLQLLNFAAFVGKDSAGKRAELETQKKGILSSEKMSAEDMDLIFDRKILDFLETDVAEAMGRCEAEGTLFKEQPFVLGVPADSLDSNFPASETVLVQGVIDVYYVVDGKAVILDYKTDRIDSATALADRYRKQLDYYGAAVHQLTGLEIGGEIIYSFGLGIVIPLV